MYILKVFFKEEEVLRNIFSRKLNNLKFDVCVYVCLNMMGILWNTPPPPRRLGILNTFLDLSWREKTFAHNPNL